MKKKTARLIDMYHTLPVRSLRTLLDHTTIERDSNGAPLPGTNDLARAREVLTCWLKQAEYELNLGGPDTPQNEMHREQVFIGTCPQCDQNDGVVVLNGERWAVCHEHFSRWKAPDWGFDAHERNGFPVVTPEQPGVLRYAEVEYHLANCIRPSLANRLRFEIPLAFETLWIWFRAIVFDIPVAVLSALFRPTAR